MISVVVSTFEKPKALVTTLRSLQGQTCTDWKAVVIGDCCGPETATAVAAIDDPRIHYLNLPDRCGEQSGPNSVGLSLALGQWVTFLNHDDVLLPDHFEHLLAYAAEQRADFVLGRVARASLLLPLPDGSQRPGFTWSRPVGMTAAMAFHRNLMLIEPSSAWLVRRAAAQRIGPWRLSTTIRRQPINDWFLRAWRRGLRIRFADRITCFKNAVGGGRRGGWLAAGNGVENDWLQSTALRMSAEELRALIDQDLGTKSQPHPEFWALPLNRLAGPRDRFFHRCLLNPLSAQVYRWTGCDAMTLLQWLLRLPVGELGRRLAAHRTGHVPQGVGNPEMI